MLKNWILASRPKTLTAAMAPVFIGSAVAYYHSSFSFSLMILILICTMLMQIGANLTNDYFDAKKGTDNTERLGPKRVTASGLISPNSVKRATIICFTLSFMIGLYLSYIGGYQIFILGVCSILFAWAYTGGPFPLSYYALGEVSAFIFFGPVAVCGTYFLHTGSISPIAILFSLIPGFGASLLMSVNNLRDYKTDRKVRKWTLASLLGPSIGRGIGLGMLLMTMFISLYSYSKFHLGVGAVISAIIPFIFISSWKNLMMGSIDQSLNKVLENSGKLIFLQGICFSIGVIYS